MPVRSATAPLTLLAGEGPSGLAVSALEYQHDVLPKNHVGRLARSLAVVLEEFTRDPDTVIADLDLRPESERRTRGRRVERHSPGAR